MPTPDKNGGDMLEQKNVSSRLIIALSVTKIEKTS